MTIATTFNNQIAATQTKFDTKITGANNEAEQLKGRANKTSTTANKNWLNVLASRAINKADNYTFQKDSIIADLEGFKAAKLLTLLDTRRIDKVTADTTHQAATGKILASNEVVQADSDQLIKSYGTGLGWITVVCLIVFIFLTILEEIHAKGSDKKETVIYSQLDLLPSVWDRWTNYLNELFLGALHRKLDKWESNLQPLPMPTALPELFILAEQEQKQIEVKPTLPVQKNDMGTVKTADIFNNKYFQIFDNDLPQNIPFSKNSKDVETITATVEIPPTSKESQYSPSNDLTSEMLEDTKTDNSNDLVKPMLHGDTVCSLDGCNNKFLKKNHRHRFCCSDHRILDWESKTGQPFGKNRGAEK